MFIPGLGLIGTGARLGLAALNIATKQTVKSTITSLTTFAAADALVESGVENISDGVNVLFGDGVSEQFNFTGANADFRAGVFAEFSFGKGKGSKRILDVKALEGTDVAPVAVSFKSPLLENKEFGGLLDKFNKSVRFDFHDGLIPEFNLISEFDLPGIVVPKFERLSKLVDTKPVFRVNQTTGDASVGTNTKIKIGPKVTFGPLQIQFGPVFETRTQGLERGSN